MSALASLALAAGGTVLLIAVAHGLRFKAPGRFDSVADALTRAGLDTTAHSAALSSDGSLVLATSLHGQFTLIEAVGDKAVARAVPARAIQPGTGGLVIIEGDGLGRPARMVRFDETALASVLAARLDAAPSGAAS
ncbi:MAG: hypothetical protein MUF14_08835 [Hyphomonadaceae bacterium]|jgi:hypothetical protein|nr:hypothetical protein [Hyphomonadaceae bacterium]